MKDKTGKATYLLEGLDCTNCAVKMEEAIKALPGVHNAVINFSAGTLEIEGSPSNMQQIVQDTPRIIQRIEPEVVPRRTDGEAPESTEAKVEKRKEIKEKVNSQFLQLAGGVVIYLGALFFRLPVHMEVGLFLLSYFLIGGKVVAKAFRNLFQGRVFDEHMLMTIATLGAFAIREYPEAVAVMLFYEIGEFLQERAVNKSRRSIQALLAIRSDYAHVKRNNNGHMVQVKPEEVAVGERIVVMPGERVPLDGRIVEGHSLIDTAALTGETLLREVEVGDEVLSGCINTSGLLVVEVEKEYRESTVAKILDLVQNAGSKKAATENFITKFARYYTPVVVGIAAAVAFLPPLFLAGTGAPAAAFSTWFYRGLIFLVISCPCALVISIPLGFFGGIGAASRKGILVKGGNYLEALNKVDSVVFDKTGTMTKGVFAVQGVFPAAGFTAEEVLAWAALAERFSTHPIAHSVIEAFSKQQGFAGRFEDDIAILSYEEKAGMGVKVRSEKGEILVGNSKLLTEEGVADFNWEQRAHNGVREIGETNGFGVAGTVLHVALEQRYMGTLLIADELREDSVEALRNLKRQGVRNLVMLTGDCEAAAVQIAAELQVDRYYANLLPQGKVEKLEQLYEQKGDGSIVFIGDGINDAPVLARADVGIAMGGLGSDAAIEAADVVIMTDEPSKLVTALQIAKKTKRVVWENIILALTVKGLVLTLGAAGIATMWGAVFADVGVAILAVFNAMRVLKS
ncbi:MAG TPA: heavy metal translocating P-type ATPase [Peptococcaceae bacterium]|nr:heavy metal translocating P-type ATPase [Peptococcaceae bacterium]HQD54478.1 heavy metal translocating P-type ATPase [Peptococcaceae bacterium]